MRHWYLVTLFLTLALLAHPGDGTGSRRQNQTLGPTRLRNTGKPSLYCQPWTRTRRKLLDQWNKVPLDASGAEADRRVPREPGVLAPRGEVAAL